MFWSSSSCCTALYCYARSALRWSISGFVGIRTGHGRMKLSSARCRARFSKEYICPTSGSRRTTRRGTRDRSCIGSISESIRGHSMNWGACGGRPRIAKGMAIPMRNGRGRIDAMARCDSPSPCPTARPRSCMRQTRHRGRGSTTSWRQLSPSSSCRRTTSGASYWGTTTWNPGDQAVRLIHPSTTCQSPKTQQDRERGDELTARVFAPGRSILSTIGAIL